MSSFANSLMSSFVNAYANSYINSYASSFVSACNLILLYNFIQFAVLSILTVVFMVASIQIFILILIIVLIRFYTNSKSYAIFNASLLLLLFIGLFTLYLFFTMKTF